MWSDFSGKAYTRVQLVARISALKWTDWKPVGITLHNTAAPTLAQWAESGPKHAARIRNLQTYYEGLGWHGGPHWFVSRDFITEFSNPLRRGTHSPSFNATFLGIEMVGDYAREPFNSGDGAKVRDNSVYLMALLCKRLGFNPDRDIVLHKEDPRTTHDCPGKFVVKADMIARVKAEMARLAGEKVPVVPDKVDGPPDPPPKWKAPDSPAFKDDGPAARMTGITATVFGGVSDHNLSAYDEHVISDKELCVALPARFKGDRPKVKVINAATRKSGIGTIEDIGPWNIDDPYWETGRRPQAESGTDRKGRKTNLAGIDLSPALARAIGINGKGKVDWEFVGAVPRQAPTEPAGKPSAKTGGVAGGAVIAAGTAGTAVAAAYGVDWYVVGAIAAGTALLAAVVFSVLRNRKK